MFVEKNLVRKRILAGEARIDGRDNRTVRAIACEVDILPKAHGSALFTRGVDVDLEAFDAPWPRQRVLLPTYPWQRIRHWRAPARARVDGTASRWDLAGAWRALPDGSWLHELPVGVGAMPYLADSKFDSI